MLRPLMEHLSHPVRPRPEPVLEKETYHFELRNIFVVSASSYRLRNKEGVIMTKLER